MRSGSHLVTPVYFRNLQLWPCSALSSQKYFWAPGSTRSRSRQTRHLSGFVSLNTNSFLRRSQYFFGQTAYPLRSIHCKSKITKSQGISFLGRRPMYKISKVPEGLREGGEKRREERNREKMRKRVPLYNFPWPRISSPLQFLWLLFRPGHCGYPGQTCVVSAPDHSQLFWGLKHTFVTLITSPHWPLSILGSGHFLWLAILIPGVCSIQGILLNEKFCVALENCRGRGGSKDTE